MKKQCVSIDIYIYVCIYIKYFAEIVKESVIETNGTLWGDRYTKRPFSTIKRICSNK